MSSKWLLAIPLLIILTPSIGIPRSKAQDPVEVLIRNRGKDPVIYAILSLRSGQITVKRNGQLHSFLGVPDNAYVDRETVANDLAILRLSPADLDHEIRTRSPRDHDSSSEGLPKTRLTAVEPLVDTERIRNAFLADLTARVPNWRDTTEEHDFKSFLETVYKQDGRRVSYREAYDQAFSALDAGAAAWFYVQYSATRQIPKAEEPVSPTPHQAPRLASVVLRYVIYAALNFLLYIAVPVLIRYGLLRRPIQTKAAAIAVLAPIAIGFTLLIWASKDELQRKVHQQAGIPYKRHGHMIGSPMLFLAMAASYSLLRRPSRNAGSDEGPHTEKQLPHNQAL